MTTCTDYIEPLNLKCIFVNTFAGSPEIFIAIGFIFLAILAAYFRMQSGVFLILIGVFLGVMAGFINTGLMFLIFILIGGLILYKIIPNIAKD